MQIHYEQVTEEAWATISQWPLSCDSKKSPI